MNADVSPASVLFNPSLFSALPFAQAFDIWLESRKGRLAMRDPGSSRGGIPAEAESVWVKSAATGAVDPRPAQERPMSPGNGLAGVLSATWQFFWRLA